MVTIFSFDHGLVKTENYRLCSTHACQVTTGWLHGFLFLEQYHIDHEILYTDKYFQYVLEDNPSALKNVWGLLILKVKFQYDLFLMLYINEI